jgi:hypothetical protein
MYKPQPKRLVKNGSLTKDFVSPRSLADSAVLHALEARSALQASGSGRYALVVAFEFDKGRMLLFVFFIALLDLDVGILVAVLQDSWDLGAFIGGSVFAVVAMLKGAVVATWETDKAGYPSH